MKNPIAKEVAKKLLQINAIKLSPQNPFSWASGLRSPIYCDNRITLSYPDIRNLIIKEGLQKLAAQSGTFDVIAGVATAGIAQGAILADYMNMPFIYVRSQAKAHGRQNSIEGRLEKDQRVLVVEDLISTGKSSLQAVETIRNVQAIPIKVISIFNYGFALSEENFKLAKIEFASVCAFSDLLEAAIELNYISEPDHKIIESWRKDPVAWSDFQKK